MQKFTVALFFLVLISCVAFAENSQFEFSPTVEQELQEAILALHANQTITRSSSSEDTENETNPAGISFRGIPWFSTLESVEDALGQVSSFRRADDLRRLSFTDYSNVSMGKDRVDGDLGCNISYSGLSVAGYTPTSTRVCYVFPIVEGQIIREFELAEMYMAYYEFKDEDYGDLGNVYEDLATKLEGLYGHGEYTTDKHFTNIMWYDVDGNRIRLQINADATYLTLAYVASTADERLDEMADVYVSEKAHTEDAIRQENANNTDGL